MNFLSVASGLTVETLRNLLRPPFLRLQQVMGALERSGAIKRKEKKAAVQ